MKNKIFLRAVIYFSAVLIICQVLNFVFPSEDIVFQRKKIDELIEKKDCIQSLTYGRSHGAGIVYDYWDKKGLNFSMGGEDIASIKYNIEFSIPKLQNLSEVLICISYSSLYFDNEALSKGNLNDARKAVYASIPSFKLISPKDYNNMIFGKMFDFMHSEYGFKELTTFLKNKKGANDINNAENEGKAVLLDSQQVVESAKVQAFDHNRDKVTALEYNHNILKDYVNKLIEISLYLKSKNIKCIFFSAPYYKQYTNLYSQSDILETENNIKAVCARTGASYYNFARCAKFADNIKYFANADHLNEKGREEFTIFFKTVLRTNYRNSADLKGAEIVLSSK